jgi:hypothetical protein
VVVGVGAALTALYLGGLAWAGHAAWSRYQAQLVGQFSGDETLQRHMWSPQPANPFAWVLIAETQEAMYVQSVDLLGGAGPIARLSRNLDDPRVRRALETREGRAWRSFARFPVARVVTASADARVMLLDARYPVVPPERNWCRMIIDVSADGVISVKTGGVSTN